MVNEESAINLNAENQDKSHMKKKRKKKKVKGMQKPILIENCKTGEGDESNTAGSSTIKKAKNEKGVKESEINSGHIADKPCLPNNITTVEISSIEDVKSDDVKDGIRKKKKRSRENEVINSENPMQANAMPKKSKKRKLLVEGKKEDVDKENVSQQEKIKLKKKKKRKRSLKTEENGDTKTENVADVESNGLSRAKKKKNSASGEIDQEKSSIVGDNNNSEKPASKKKKKKLKAEENGDTKTGNGEEVESNGLSRAKKKKNSASCEMEQEKDSTDGDNNISKKSAGKKKKKKLKAEENGDTKTENDAGVESNRFSRAKKQNNSASCKMDQELSSTGSDNIIIKKTASKKKKKKLRDCTIDEKCHSNEENSSSTVAEAEEEVPKHPIKLKKKKEVKKRKKEQEFTPTTEGGDTQDVVSTPLKKKMKQSDSPVRNIDTTHQKTQVDLGQWETAELADISQQEKFKRLLGGLKSNRKVTTGPAGDQSVLSRLSGVCRPTGKLLWGKRKPDNGGFASMAMNAEQSRSLACKLEQQFNNSLQFNIQKMKEGNKAKGFGFDDPSFGKKHYIDKHKINSVSLE